MEIIFFKIIRRVNMLSHIILLLTMATNIGEAQNFSTGEHMASPLQTIESGQEVSDIIRGNGMMFTQNKGQIVDVNQRMVPNILFKGNDNGADVYIRKTGISYVLSNVGEVLHNIDKTSDEAEKKEQMTLDEIGKLKSKLMQNAIVKFHRLDMDFVDANLSSEIIGSDQVEGFTNYYYGHCTDGITKVPSYNIIVAKGVYNNIDVKFYGGKERGLKYDIVVNPGGNPNEIKMKYSGANDIKLDEGKLRIETTIGALKEFMPRVYQNVKGRIVDIDAKYVFTQGCKKDTFISFQIGIFDPNYSLIIDPWATYFSGSGQAGMQSGSGLCTDKSGNVIFTGATGTSDFPVSPGAFQMVLGHSGGTIYSAFLAKFNANGSFVFGTYFGGASPGGYGTGVAVDSNNDILLSGVTGSTNFPVKNPGGGAYFQSVYGGGNQDAFIAKFTSNGLLTWSTLYGGSGYDRGNDVMTDGANNVILVGSTSSGNFPTQIPYQASLSGTQDAFVVKFNSGCVRQWATYYGGTSTEEAIGVACDIANNIFFTGNTASTNFPVLGAFQTNSAGSIDAFAVKLNGTTGFPLWSTYYGGVSNDAGVGIAIDNFGNCIVVGNTESNNNIASVGSNQPIYGSTIAPVDAFIAKFSSIGSRLWATYHGGTNSEQTGGCAVDTKNNIYWYGEVEDAQPDLGWISTCSYQNKYNGLEDHLISKFDPNGKLLCTTAVGGSGEEDFDAGIVMPHYDIAADDPFLYITAHVRGGGYPVSAGAFQTVPNGMIGGGIDAFVNQLCLNICQPQFIGINISVNNSIVCPNIPVSFSSTINNICDTTGLKFRWTFGGGTPNSSTLSNPVISYSAPGFYSAKLVVTTPCQKDSVVKTNYIIVNPCTSSINISSSNDTICSGSCSNIVASGSGGLPPYTFSWNTGSTNAAFSVCPATSTDYTVKVTDINGDYITTTTSVVVKPILILSTNSTNISCSTSGKASVTVTNGVAPFTYTWSNGQKASVDSGLVAGVYTVTVIDGNGCTVAKTVTITGTSAASGTFVQSPTGTVCTGALVNFTNTGTLGTYTWEISPITPTNVSGTTTDFSYTFLSAGNYNVSHTVISSGCTNKIVSNVKVIDCSVPSVTATSDSICSGLCANVISNPLGGTLPYTYSWSTGETSQNINPCPVSTSSYTLKVTDSGGKTATTIVRVTVNPTVTAISRRVWPGDADNDGVANNNDLLAIGVGYGTSGTTRCNASTSWTGQPSWQWPQSLITGVNYKHVDCDGNGAINSADTLPIHLNYGSTHPLKIVAPKYIAGIPDLYIKCLDDTVLAGSTTKVQIGLGTVSTQANNVYGAAFSIDFNDLNLIDISSTIFFPLSSWLGTKGTNLISLYHIDMSANNLNFGTCKTDHVNNSGNGEIAELVCKIPASFSGPEFQMLKFSPNAIKVIANDGNVIPVNSVTDSIVIRKLVTNIDETREEDKLIITPNPFGDETLIQFKEINASFYLIINDIAGREINRILIEKGQSRYILHRGDLSDGIYILRAVIPEGVVNRKIIVN